MGSIQPFDIEIIIPTLAAKNRSESLKTAVNSVLSQQGVNAGVIAVINGSKCYSPLVTWLENQQKVKCLYQKIGSPPIAQLKGRKQVKAPFFGFLDDDDFLLPGALRNRLKAMLDQQIDVVIDNGWKKNGNRKNKIISDIKACEVAPQVELLKSNWMASCSALYRSESILSEFFKDFSYYMEWTYVAFKLTLEYKIKFIESYGYIVNVSYESLSFSREYIIGSAETIKKMLIISTEPSITRLLKKIYIDSIHDLFNLMLHENENRKAFKLYLQCLCSPYGWKFFFNFRFLFLNLLNRTFK